MALSLQDEWTIVAGGLVAHADEILVRGVVDIVLRLVGPTLDDEARRRCRTLLEDQDALEQQFAALAPPPREFHEELLHRCWRVALADGTGSDVEEMVHDRIAAHLGVDAEQVSEWRRQWTTLAASHADVTVALAAMFVNLDGRLDFHEAVHFEDLLGRSPVPLGRRIELAALLNDPPSVDDVVERLKELSLDERLAALGELVPLVRESPRPDREREEFLDVSSRVGVSGAAAERLLASG